MKRLLILMTALLLGSGANAQQALWGVASVDSPEISDNKTVTFRLKAPDAQSVQVMGDMLPTQKIETPQGSYEVPGVGEMSKNADGVWTFTTAPLAPELYSYNFLIDGVKVADPNNVYQIRDVATVFSVFIVGGDRADLYKVNEVPHGTVSRIWYDSPMLSMQRRLTVYTPAGYENSGRKRYPVFYLLHGMGGDEEAWIALGRTAQILDNLIAQGKAQPMIVVMTNGNASQQAAPGESAAGFSQPTMQLPKTMDGSFESAFPDVVNFVDKHFRTIANKEHRAIAGLSMGGFHSLHISKTYPRWFDYVGLFSAAIIPEQGNASPLYADMEGKLAVQFAQKPALYWIAIGKTDFLYQSNVEFRKMLDANGFQYVYYESEGGHIWRNWRIYLTEFVPQLFK